MQPQPLQQLNSSQQVKQTQPQPFKSQQTTQPTPSKQLPQQQQQKQQQQLLDFSQMFKKNGNISRRPTLSNKNLASSKNIPSQPNWLLQIPAKLQITIKDLQQRRFMNMERWNNVVKSFDKKNEEIAAVVTIGKWLERGDMNGQGYQSKGNKFTMKKVKQLANKNGLLQQLANKSRRQSILQLFNLIISQNNLKQQYSPLIIHQLSQSTLNNLLPHLLQQIKSQNKCFIYICHGFILYLIGYQNTPLVPLDAYKKLTQINPQKMQMWFIFGTFNKQYTPLMIKRWTDVEIQLKRRYPEYLNLDETKKGIQIMDGNGENVSVKDKEVSCVIQFTRKNY